jgi:LytR cell envelope-related transcriptional attenuator
VGARIRTVAVVAVVLAAGAFLGSALAQWWAVPGVEDAALGPVPLGERVRVEVLNGGGRVRMARAATQRLRGAGFDVVFFGNASTFDRDSSVVLDRVGNQEWARRVADELGIRRIRTEPDTNLYLDVSVVLGMEWEPPPAPDVERASDGVRWWDPRRLFRKRPGAPDSGERLADPGEEEGG